MTLIPLAIDVDSCGRPVSQFYDRLLSASLLCTQYLWMQWPFIYFWLFHKPIYSCVQLYADLGQFANVSQLRVQVIMHYIYFSASIQIWIALLPPLPRFHPSVFPPDRCRISPPFPLLTPLFRILEDLLLAFPTLQVHHV